MTVEYFNYKGKPRELYVMYQGERPGPVSLQECRAGYASGIDMGQMTEEEKVQFTKIVEKYEQDIAPFIQKYYRRFHLPLERS